MNIENISKLMEHDVQVRKCADMIYYHCENLHSMFGEDNACKNCILSEYDDDGVYLVCGVSDRKPLDWM